MRVVNRVLALVFGLAVLAAAVVIVIEVVAALVGANPVVWDWPASYRWAQRTPWDSTIAVVIGALLALVGLVLLIAQLVPRRPGRLPVRSDAGPTDAAITRRGLKYTLSEAVNDVDGVRATKVVVRRRSVKVKARARVGVPASVREIATDTARRRVAELDLQRPPRVKVDVGTGGR